MRDNRNYKWTKKDIAKQYKRENPNWSWKECWDKANTIYRELNKINSLEWENNKTYFKLNKPFSFYDTKDDEFSDTYHEW